MILHTLAVVLSAWMAVSAGQTVYFMESTQVVGKTEKDSMWAVDVNSKTVSQVPLINHPVLPDDSTQDFLSGATVCNGIYYAIWAEFVSQSSGIAAVNISGDKSWHSKMSASAGNTALFHAVYCHPTEAGKLIAVRSDPANSNQTTAQFSVRILDFFAPGEIIADQLVGTFDSIGWGASDTIFGFVPSKGQVWAAFPEYKSITPTGTIEIITVGSGSGKPDAYKLPFDSGYPYMILPDAGDGSAYGAFYHGKMPGDCCEKGQLSWKKVSLSNGKAAVSNQMGVDPYPTVWTSGGPTPICDGKLWSLPHAQANTLVGSDPMTLKPILTIDISKENENNAPGGIGCA